MSDGTKIEWTDATWNVVNGCSVISPGCKHCYAMKQAHRFPVRQGLTQKTSGGMVWTGEVRFNEAVLTQPLRWKRPRRIFVCAHGDLFHEKVPDEWIDRVFAVMALAPQHTFQVLTKRPERMRAYLRTLDERPLASVLDHDLRNESPRRRVPSVNFRFDEQGRPTTLRLPLPHVWLGTSVEDQQRADERIPVLLDTPAAVRWLSMEPLLGPVDLRKIKVPDDPEVRCTDIYADALTGLHTGTCAGDWFGDLATRSLPRAYDPLDWIVLGGESGMGARPMAPAWVRQIRDQCTAAGVPFLFKQWGEWGPVDDRTAAERPSIALDSDVLQVLGKRAAGRLLDGVQHDGYPA